MAHPAESKQSFRVRVGAFEERVLLPPFRMGGTAKPRRVAGMAGAEKPDWRVYRGNGLQKREVLWARGRNDSQC